jgi:stage II sporulation protein AA (anti-sigma F factor antagonist)
MAELAQFQVFRGDGPLGSDGAGLVVVTGEIDMSNAGEFEQAIAQAWQTHQRAVVVDLTRANFMGSDAFNALLMAAKTVGAGGGEIRLRKPSDSVRRVLGILGLEATFPIEE